MSQHGIGGTYKEPSDARIPTFHVTGTLTPDSTCNYVRIANYMGAPAHQRQDGLFYIWFSYDEPEGYIISDALGQKINCWYHAGDFEEGTYEPMGTNTGIATVSSGPH